MSVFIFVLGIVLIAYVYGGYGMALALIRKKKPVSASVEGYSEGQEPMVSFVVYAPVDSQTLKGRLANLMALDWPADKIEALIVLNGADEATQETVRSFAGRYPVKLVACARQGKTTAQNLALQQAVGEIVVFTDADTVFAPETLCELLAPFADPAVGGTTGRVGLCDADGALSDKTGYLRRYEDHVRGLESDLGWLASGSAPVLALRRGLCGGMPAFASDEAFLPLSVVAAGQRMVFCSSALAYETLETDPARLYAAQVRATMRSVAALRHFPQLLDFRRDRGQAFVMASHKAARPLGGLALVLMTLAALPMLLAGGVTSLLAALHLALVSYGIIGLKEGREGRLPDGFAGAVSRFLLLQAAHTVGLWKSALALGKRG